MKEVLKSSYLILYTCAKKSMFTKYKRSIKIIQPLSYTMCDIMDYSINYLFN